VCPECGTRIGREQSEYICPSCGARTDGVGACPVCGAAAPAKGERGRGWIARIAWAGLAVAALVVIWLVGVRSSALRGLVRQGVSGVLSSGVVEETVSVVEAGSPTQGPPLSATLEATEATALADPTRTPTLMPTATRIASVTPSATAGVTATWTRTATANPTPALPSATPRIHVVVAGDYIEKLAVIYDVDQDAIAAANGITLETILRLGQELVIPVPGQNVGAMPGPTETWTATATAVVSIVTPDEVRIPPTVAPPTASPSSTPSPTPSPAGRPATHTVAEGENLSYLAMEYDVSMEAIAKANDITVGAILSIGQELVIPGLDATPTATPLPTQTATPVATLTPTATRVPTPTWLYVVPVPLYPPAGEPVPQDRGLLLGWTSVGVLAERDSYLVDIEVQSDAFQPLERTEILTRATSIRVDVDDIGGSGTGELLSWRVRVVRVGAEGRETVSPTSETRWVSVAGAGAE